MNWMHDVGVTRSSVTSHQHPPAARSVWAQTSGMAQAHLHTGMATVTANALHETTATEDLLLHHHVFTMIAVADLHL